ncbi:MAG: PilZ domain-containing protein [Candidatus Acidiferrales bacterium]
MSAARAMEPTPERRRERRVPVHLPMVVRGTDHAGEKFEERTSSVNLCRGGAAFATRFAIDLGDRLDIFISAPSPAKDPDTEFSTQGRVVHLDRGIDGHKQVVGVEFTGPRFHRIFVSEATS